MVPLLFQSQILPDIFGVGFQNSWLKIELYYTLVTSFPGKQTVKNGGSVSKESACNAGYSGSVPGLGSSSEEENGNPFQYSCLGKLPWTEEPGELQSRGSQGVGHNWTTNTHTDKMINSFPDWRLWWIYCVKLSPLDLFPRILLHPLRPADHLLKYIPLLLISH